MASDYCCLWYYQGISTQQECALCPLLKVLWRELPAFLLKVQLISEELSCFSIKQLLLAMGILEFPLRLSSKRSWDCTISLQNIPCWSSQNLYLSERSPHRFSSVYLTRYHLCFPSMLWLRQTIIIILKLQRLMGFWGCGLVVWVVVWLAELMG